MRTWCRAPPTTTCRWRSPAASPSPSRVLGGWDRSSADGFDDYFRQLTDFEPKRAAVYGIRHFAWLCLNPRKARTASSRAGPRADSQVSALANGLGIGEIGLNRVTRNEIATFRDHVELALEHDQLIHIHTPHLEDKYKGTRTIVDILTESIASSRRA
jgi:predicted metal-dependent TIM-barrel fold hydrolase